MIKVVKFGGSSVGTPESILKVKDIILKQSEPCIVVVSALGGITDSLVKASSLAEQADTSFRELISCMESRHLEMCDAVVEDRKACSELKEELSSLFAKLRSICEGVCLLKVLPKKTYDEILSYGERLSSRILTAMITGSVLYDSLDFIKTVSNGHIDVVDSELSGKLIRAAFADFPRNSRTAVVPGFISSDSASGEITNLGRGGSDYSASLIAAALDAGILEIWTDVDGFMTADPKMIKTSYTIDEMTYEEAMELCNFGAKVVYPPTLYAVCRKKIPILIKNTFNQDAPGTMIKSECRNNERSIKGISSIDDICLITLSGTSMVGIVGVDSRIFSALASESISAFLVSQAASETGISIGVSKKDAERACKVLDKAFSQEISAGSIAPVKCDSSLAAVAVVGENMRHHPGIAGKLFTTLGRSGISIVACAQGSAETNISFIIDRKDLRKALNVIHDSFFLSEYQELNIFLCGVGTVGGSLLEQIAGQRETLMAKRGLKLNVVGIANSSRALIDREGIELDGCLERLHRATPSDINSFKDEIIKMNIFNSVFVDCTASKEVAAIYGELLEHNVNIVAANKIAASSSYSEYRRLKDTARSKGVKFLFETNVGAGLPIINTINSLRNSGDHILKIEAVLSGTLNYIFNTISADIPFSRTVKMAKEEGYSEPDPRIDLCGMDVVRKLVILSRESGYVMEQEDVRKELFVPDEFFSGSLEEFWKRLPELDADFEERRRRLEAEGKCWRFVACLEDGKGSVSLREVSRGHSFYNLAGSNNIILLTTERYKQYPMLIQGYGAGAEVTAAGVFGDIMNIANI